MNFVLKLDPVPKFDPQNEFLNFSDLSFCQFYYQIWNVAQCVVLTEFLDNIFKIPIFEPKWNKLS